MNARNSAPVVVNDCVAEILPDRRGHPAEEFHALELSPEMRAELLDPEAWTGILYMYASTMKMAVALTDINGHRIGSCHNPQPVWLLAHGEQSASTGCPFCLGFRPQCNAVQDTLGSGGLTLAHDVAGLAHVAVPLFFGGQQLGALIAGQVFDRYPDPLSLRRLARDLEVSAQQLWEVAIKQLPLSATTIYQYGALLKVLGDAFVRQRYALFLARELNETNRRFERRTEALAKSNEELEHANENLQQFAYSASHDLQEPLRTVAIYGQLFKELYQGKIDSQADEFVGYMVEASKRMEMLVRDLLAYTRAAAGSEQPEAAVDANLALEKALGFLTGVIQDRKAVVTHEHLPTLQMQEVHLQQLFQNVVGNAIKYSKPGEPPVIHISAEPRSDSWIISVSDNGIGIDPRYALQVFGIFKRLHTKEHYTGTGIGLAICKKIVERYRGRIWVESELGKGSTFRIELHNQNRVI